MRLAAVGATFYASMGGRLRRIVSTVPEPTLVVTATFYGGTGRGDGVDSQGAAWLFGLT